MRFILVFLVLVSLSAQAAQRVAFLEVYDAHGRLVQYEPNSRFGHTALEVNGGWLQSYPGEGVKIVSLKKLKERGVIRAFVPISKPIRSRDYVTFLNKPFDFSYDWSDEEIYCSELLAKLLSLPPEPMEFNRQVWPKSYWELEGQPGLSPDKLYRQLTGVSPWEI